MNPHGKVCVLLLLAIAGPPLGAQEIWRTDFDKKTIDMAEVVSGGPSKDGIRSIDLPRFVSVDAADAWLDDAEPVAVVRIGETVRAYPLQILIYHEIVNDQVAGTPVTVTYCPLCNTVLAFDRRFDDRVLDFGTTGRLRHSDLLMYDRQTETWWQQATGEGVIGEYAGRQLTFIPSPLLSWRDVKTLEDEVQVLSRDTGFEMPYGKNPYESYDTRGPFPAYFKAEPDERLPAMERVVALREGHRTAAVPFSVLRETGVVQRRFGGRAIVVLWVPGTTSAVDREDIAGGRDVGSSAVFVASVDGRPLRFQPAGSRRFRDLETGSTWSVSGRALHGRLAGARLTEVAHGNPFWFAWSAFFPDTEIWRP